MRVSLPPVKRTSTRKTNTMRTTRNTRTTRQSPTETTHRHTGMLCTWKADNEGAIVNEAVLPRVTGNIICTGRKAAIPHQWTLPFAFIASRPDTRHIACSSRGLCYITAYRLSKLSACIITLFTQHSKENFIIASPTTETLSHTPNGYWGRHTTRAVQAHSPRRMRGC